MLPSDISPGVELSQNELINVFKVGVMGGMRKSGKTNSLVLISDPSKGFYDDKWENNIFHYTGMGKKGDQSLDHAQNKTLNNSKNNGINLYLFEVFRERRYTYRGKVELAGKPYQDTQIGSDDKLRKVWVFPLRLIQQSPISFEHFVEGQSLREKKTRKLSDKEIKKRLKGKKASTSSRQVTSNQFERDPYVIEFVKRASKGICQLCNKPAPFNNSKGEPFLEVHHIIWLAKGGSDTVDNAVALCPNCHRKMHIVSDRKDIQILMEKASKYIV